MDSPGKMCLYVALVLFGIGAFMSGPPTSPTYPWYGRLMAAGLFFYTLSIILGGAH